MYDNYQNFNQNQNQDQGQDPNQGNHTGYGANGTPDQGAGIYSGAYHAGYKSADDRIREGTAGTMAAGNGTGMVGGMAGESGAGASGNMAGGNGAGASGGMAGGNGAGASGSMTGESGAGASGNMAEGNRSGAEAGSTGSISGMNGSMHSNGTYRYSSRYPNNFTAPQTDSPAYNAGQKKRKEKRQMGGAKKIFISMGMGVGFGVCAGLSFFAVEKITGFGMARQETVITEALQEETGSKESAGGVTDSTAEGTKVTPTSSVSTVVSDISGVVKEVMPSMVSIVNTFTENISYWGQNFSQEAVASGSGIIVGMNDTELLVVTNFHVVEDATKLMVSFADDSAAEAQVKGTDSSKDLAVIAIPLSELSEETMESISVAKLGDSDSLTIGEPAIAIGNALGYGQSVTTGVISAVNREVEMSNNVSGTFIQTDAAINPGNSGGALLNVNGEVIGINSNKIGGSAVEGMGYAIPISAAKPIIEDLMNRETRTRVDEADVGYLGISGVSVTADVSNIYGMPEGVYVAQVFEGTGAYEAGITRGSIITKIDDITVATMEELRDALQYYAVGDSVEVVIMQPGVEGYEEKTVTVVLGPKQG